MSMFNSTAKAMVPNLVSTHSKSLGKLGDDDLKVVHNQRQEDMEAKAKEFASGLFRMYVKQMLPKGNGMMGSGASGEVWNSFYVDAVVDASKGHATYGIEDGVLRTLMKNQEVSNGG